MKILISHIIRQLNEVKEGKPWMGESFRKKIEALAENDALTRPLQNLHSVAEIISHLTVWRKDASLKIRTGRGKLTIESKENWLHNDILKGIGWEKIMNDYNESLAELIDLIKDREDDFLNEIYFDNDYKGNYSYLYLLEGILQHDIYHLGQIGIVIKLLDEMKANLK